MSKKQHVKTGKQWSSNQRKVEALNPCERFKKVTPFEAVVDARQMADIQNAVKNQAKIALEQEAEVEASIKESEKSGKIKKSNPK